METYLRTDRLILRRFERSDLDNLWALYGDPEVMRHISLPTITRTELEERVLPDLLAEAERYDHRGCGSVDFGYWAAQTRDGGEFVGRLGLHPAVPTEDPLEFWKHGPPGESTVMSLGYRIRRSAWGRG